MLRTCENPLCPIEFAPSRKNQLYHSNACRQQALRERQKQENQNMLLAHCAQLPISVATKIRSIQDHYGQDPALEALTAINLLLKIAHAWPKDVQHLFQQERQDDSELAHYKAICDLSDRSKLEVEWSAVGSLLHYHYILDPHIAKGEDAWRTFMLNADDEMLAKAIVNAKYYYHSLIAVEDDRELKQAQKRILQLEQEVTQYIEGLQTQPVDIATHPDQDLLIERCKRLPGAIGDRIIHVLNTHGMDAARETMMAVYFALDAGDIDISHIMSDLYGIPQWEKVTLLKRHH